jgi:hypothetical protein
MSRNIEHIERKQSHAALLLDVCRGIPNVFIPISDVRHTFGWSQDSTRMTVSEARQLLKDDALYTITMEEGIVYEPARVAVGERIIPSKFRPDPTWLSEFPKGQDLRDLLQHLRFATVVSETKAAPLLTPHEHLLLIRFVADMASRQVSSMDRLSPFVPKLTQKLTAETQGEWTIARQRRGGLCYMLQHSGM